MPRATPLRGLFFDMDDTLVDFNAAMRAALGDTLNVLRRTIGPVPEWLDVPALVAMRDEAALEIQDQRPTHEAVRLEGFRRALVRLGRPDEALARHLAAYYVERRFAACRPYEDAVPALQALGCHYVLGVITNGNTYPERCGLAGVFRVCVYSQEEGVSKPDPRLFEIALERVGIEPAEALHVGDSLESDVAGARAAGLRAVWLNRDGAPNETSIQPDWEIQSLAALPGICSLAAPRS